MTLLKLLEIANKGYDEDGTLAMCYHAKTGKLKGRKAIEKVGDGLARFVVVEISETFDPEASSADQVAEAIRVMESAGREIEGVIGALAKER